jgi:cytochrome c oxidase subunit 2
MRRRVPLTILPLAGLLVASCSGDHDVLSPQGSQADGIAALGWFMIATATVIAVVFLGLLGYGLTRGGLRAWRPGDGFVVAGGIVLPLAVIVVLTGLSLNQLNDRVPADAVHIEVIGHQFWWEVHYPDDGVTTANELAIPVGRPVELTLRSVDVQHSFWVPGLAGKIDLYPGHTNHLLLDAHSPGRYRGQCAEFCGIQHAQMIFEVTAEPADRYDAWVRAQAAPAAEPATDDQRAGRDALVQGTCGSCHAVRGTGARGDKGPDLTHLASRQTIGAGAAPLNRGNLGGWIANAQTIKPGNNMPPVPLTPDELRHILDYLESLR